MRAMAILQNNDQVKKLNSLIKFVGNSFWIMVNLGGTLRGGESAPAVRDEVHHMTEKISAQETQWSKYGSS